MVVKELKIEDKLFPKKLKNIPNPPKSIFLAGDISLLEEKIVGSVGSRNCTDYGKRISYELGKECTKYGYTLVSGMAKGIDYYSHYGAIKSGGKTIAVLGNGLDICYPKENINLYNEIIKNGLLVSEYPIGFEPKKYTFPMRNRIIAALSDALCIVEAEINSGSLITAECAVEQGKDVYAFPGNIFSKTSLGTNKLIQDGAKILTTVSDIFYDLGEKRKLCFKNLDSLEIDIIKYLKENGENSIKELAYTFNLEEKTMKDKVVIMQMKGLVEYNLGKVFVDFL